MQARYIRENRGCSLCIEDVEFKEFEMKMIESNHINGIISPLFREINNQILCMYDITSKMTLVEAFSKKEMRAEDLYRLTDAIQTAVKNLDEYMLGPEGLLLDPEYIFYDINSNEFSFIYCAVSEDFYLSLKKLFEYILGIISHSDNEVVTYAYGIYRRLNTGNYALTELFEIERRTTTTDYEVRTEEVPVKDILPETVTEEREEPDKLRMYTLLGVAAAGAVVFLVFLLFTVSSGLRPSSLSVGVCALICVIIGAGEFLLIRFYKENRHFFVKMVDKDVEIPYTRDHVRIIMPQDNSEEDNRTVILTAGVLDDGHMIEWRERGAIQHYRIEKDVIIGSSPEKCDCVIGLEGVSRMHARITKEGNKFFIKDLNSTNGTRVNGEELVCFQMKEICMGDRIIIGKAEVLFH